MNEHEKWDYISRLDDELLIGGVILSEWSVFLIRDADQAFCCGANLATILAAQAAIEAHLRYEYHHNLGTTKLSFYQLIESSPLSPQLQNDLHTLRKYRNQWVHVNDPHEDEQLLQRPEYYETELEGMAMFAIRIMRQVIYLEQLL